MRYAAIYGLLFTLFVTVQYQTIAQQADTSKLSIEYNDVKVSQFLDDLYKLTGFYAYYDSKELDSVFLTVSLKNESLPTILAEAFKNTGVYFSIDDSKHIFLSKKAMVRTSLPTIFSSADSTGNKEERTLDRWKGKKDNTPNATLENKLYEIGDPKANPAGKVTIGGYVRDARSGEPVSGVSIQVEKLNIGVTTDDYGYYSIGLPPGKHTFNIQGIGMTDTRRMIALYSSGEMDIELKGEIATLRSVIVSAQKVSNVKGSQMGMQRIDIRSIKQIPTIFGEPDVLRAVLSTPGVKTVGEASTGLNVRGGSSDQNLILFNDATIYNPSHFFGMFSAFNPDVLKDVTLYKGTIPARFGGRLSSVLDISSREGNKKNIAGSAGVGPLTSRITLEGPVVKEKVSFIAGGRLTYANWLLGLLPHEYKNSEASFYDVSFAMTGEIDKTNSVYVTGYLSKDRFNLNSDTAYTYGNRSLSVKWKRLFNNKLNALFTAGLDKYNYEISSKRNPINAYKMNFDIGQTYLRTHFNYYLDASHTLDFGMNAMYYRLRPGAFLPEGNESLVMPDKINAEQGLEAALYLNDKFNVSPDLSIEAGIRFSAFSVIGPRNINNYLAGQPKNEENIVDSTYYGNGKFIETFGGPEYRFSLRYSFSQDLSVKAGFNTQRQYIHMLSNTAAMAPTDIWKLSDPNIRPQHGMQVSAGIYKNFKNNTIETSIEVYYKKIRNYLDYKSGANLMMNHHIETDVFYTRGKAYGAEFLIKKTVGKFNGWLSYTWSRILLKQDDPNAGEVINKGNFYPANYDKPHDATATANYRINHRFSISMNVTYSTGRPITMPIGKYYFSGSYRTLFADRNAQRIPDYFRSDFSINIEGNHRVKQKTHNSWTIGAYNLTGRKNPYSVYYVSEQGTINGYKLSIFGSIIPFMTYNIRF